MTQLADIGDGCDLIILAVSDDALEPCIHQLAAVAESAPAFAFHVSGRSGAGILAPLDAKGWGTAAVHPAMTFTGDPITEAQQMIGARFAVTASTAQSVAKARAIVALLGGVPVEISEAHRPLYHAALCHGANHLVTLIVGATEALAAAGVDDPAALLAPLARAALANGLGKGMAGLSGPLLRGDAATIGGHLVALRQDCPLSCHHIVPWPPPRLTRWKGRRDQAGLMPVARFWKRMNDSAEDGCATLLSEW